MKGFDWTIDQTVARLSRSNEILSEAASRNFSHPHEGIWGNGKRFVEHADIIINSLSVQQRQLFQSVCLASWLLNPFKAPAEAEEWLRTNCDIHDLIGIDCSWEQIVCWKWGRVAVAVADTVDKNKGRVFYCLAASRESDEINEVLPNWALSCMDKDACNAVETAAYLANRKFPEMAVFLWPILDNSLYGINGKSLGLPAYLSFCTLVSGSKLLSPPYLATGELDEKGNLLEVCALDQKLKLAQNLKFASFIYPLDANTAPLMSSGKPDAVGVKNLEEAEKAWGLDSESIRKRLMPVPFIDDLDRMTQNFTGRQWLVEKIDAWIASPTADKVYWLTGAPGVGKSSLSAWLCKYRKQSIASKHFCDFSNEDRRDPVKFVRSLAFQLSESCPQYEEQQSKMQVDQLLNNFRDAKSLFDALILRPLADIQSVPGKRLIIVIDALDEAADNGCNGIAQIVAKYSAKFPDWLCFLITSRYDDELKANLSPATPHLLDANAKQNQDDIIACLQDRLPESTTEQQLDILSHSEGIFLYARHCIDEIQSGRLSLEHLDQLPQGLNDIYRQQFDRHFATDLQYYKKEIRPLLRIICTSFEPLPLGVVRSILGLKNKEALFDLLEMLGSLFPRTGDRDTDCIAPHHRSIKDWISVRELCGHYYVDVESGHSELAEYGWNEYLKNPDTLSAYLFAWLPRHLSDCGRNDDAAELLKDFSFMMARTKAGKFDQLLTDYKKINHPSLKDEGAFFDQFGSLIQKGTAKWPAYKILLQLAIENANYGPVALGAEKYLEDEKCDWAWLRAETVTKHSAEIIQFRALSDGRMMTFSSDMTLRLLDCHGNLIALIDPKIYDFVVIENIMARNNGGLISWTNKGEFYLWDESIENPTRVNLSNHRSSEGVYNQNAGALTFTDGSFLVSRSSDKNTIISAHDINGAIKAELTIDRLISYLERSEATLLSGGMRLLDDGCVLLKSYFSALIVNQELDIIHKFIVTEQYKALVGECADDELECLDFMLGGIYPLEDGRFISSASRSIYIWCKNCDGIYEIEKRVQPYCRSSEALFSIERLAKLCSVSYTDKFVYLTDGINEYISETPQAENTTDLPEIYLDFPMNRTIHGHAQSIIDDKISAGINVTTNKNIIYSISYGMDAHLIDNNGNLIVHYNDPLFNITNGYSDKFGCNTNRFLTTSNSLKLLFKSGGTICWACLAKPSLQNLSPTGQYYAAYWDYNIYSQSSRMNDTSSPRFATQLAPNGRAVVITADGNLSVLNTYVGNQRVSLEELETKGI